MNKNTQMSWLYGTLAILAGAAVNLIGDRLLGVRLEYFFGVYTFSPLWIVDLTVVPLISGLVVSLIYGLGGKLLCYFAPLVARVWSYFEVIYFADLPAGYSILPFYYWVMLVLVAVEVAAIGGVAGEILVKKTYGRRPHHLIYKEKIKETKP